MFIFDAHLDLSMNAMEWNRDFRCDLDEIRRREASLTDKKDRGNGVVSFPAMRRGNIGLCVATQIARYVKPENKRSGWASPEQAWAHTQAQLAWYRAMEEDQQLLQITTKTGLNRHLDLWLETTHSQGNTPNLPIGYILSLEGADSILTLDHLTRAYEYGLRALGPSHYGPGTYSAGTDSEGGFSVRGRELLKEMDRLGMILDLTHLTDEALNESFNQYQGPMWASHCNCRALVPHQRQLSDEHIKLLIERKGVIGVVFDAWMMVPGWKRGISTPAESKLKIEAIVSHIDHICQMAGNAENVGIGSDLDGGFGTEQCPTDLDSIERLQLIATLLEARGYQSDDIERVMFRNWVNFLDRSWVA